MLLPPASAAPPRLPSPGSAAAPRSGSGAGFDAVMGGVIASGARGPVMRASGAQAQQASDDGGPGKPAADSLGTVAHTAQRGHRAYRGQPGEAKDDKDAADQGDTADSAPGAVAGVPHGPAIPGIVAETAAPQGTVPGPKQGSAQGLAPAGGGVPAGSVPLEAIAGTPTTGNLAAPAGSSASGGPGLAMRLESTTAPSGPGAAATLAGSATATLTGAAAAATAAGATAVPSGNTGLGNTALGNAALGNTALGNPPLGSTVQGTLALSKTPGASATSPFALDLSTTGPSLPAAIPGGGLGASAGQSGSGQTGSAQPIAAPATSPALAPATAPASGGLETAANKTAALAGEAGTAVVLPAGKPAAERDPEITGQGAPVTAAGSQTGIPAVLQPTSALQQFTSTPTAGAAIAAPQADPAKLLPQVTGPLFSLAAAAPGRHVMTLRLSPEDLGPLTVRAHIDGTGVRIELFAPGEAGREAVRSILPELRRGLGESGFGASLDLSEHNTPADAGAGGWDTRGSDSQNRRPVESPAFPRGSDGEPDRLPRNAVVLPRSSTSSLDILV